MTRPRLILAIRCVTLLGLGALLCGSGWLCAGLASALVGLMIPAIAAAATGNIIYLDGTLNHVAGRFTSSASDWSGSTASGTYSNDGSPNSFTLDKKNSNLYFCNASSGVISRLALDDYGGTPTTVLTATYGVYSIDCDPTNSKLYYLSYDSSGGGTQYIRKVNYDGTGDASVISWSGNIGVSSDGLRVKYDATTDRVFYTKYTAVPAGGTHAQLRYVQSDGTGDTLIADITDGLEGSRIGALTIDYTGQRIFWCQFTNSFSSLIRKATTSGGSITTVVNLGTGGMKNAMYYCQNEDKLYAFDTSSNFSRMNPDGSSVQNLNAIADLSGTHVFYLGETMETLGASAIYS